MCNKKLSIILTMKSVAKLSRERNTFNSCTLFTSLQKIIVKTDGKEVVVEQGGVVQAPVEDIGKPVKKTGKTGSTGGLPGVAALPKLVGGVLPTMTTAGGGGSGSVVMASVLPPSKSQVMAAAKSGKGVLQVTAPPQPCECLCINFVVDNFAIFHGHVHFLIDKIMFMFECT